MGDIVRIPDLIDVEASYKVIDRVVSHGFDYVGVTIRGLRIVLKTLTVDEEESVRVRAFGSGSIRASIPWLLAYGTYQIGTAEVLLDRSNDTLESLYRFYEGLPAGTVYSLHSTLSDLSYRLDKASSLFQGYMFTPQARSRWLSFRSSGGRWGVDTRSDHSIGSSLLRELWVRVNGMLDSEEAEDHRWDQAIFITSAQNPKGAKDSGTRRDGRKETMAEERAELAKYGSMENRDIELRIQKSVDEPWHAPLVTQKDIIDELERQMSGQQDRHDLFVDSYFTKQSEMHAAAKAEEDARLAALRKKMRDAGMVRKEGTREATPEEMARLDGKVIKITGKRVLRHR